jgi:hypothetical protein
MKTISNFIFFVQHFSGTLHNVKRFIKISRFLNTANVYPPKFVLTPKTSFLNLYKDETFQFFSVLPRVQMNHLQQSHKKTTLAQNIVPKKSKKKHFFVK